jgi:RHS repeat-associated protein
MQPPFRRLHSGSPLRYDLPGASLCATRASTPLRKGENAFSTPMESKHPTRRGTPQHVAYFAKRKQPRFKEPRRCELPITFGHPPVSQPSLRGGNSLFEYLKPKTSKRKEHSRCNLIHKLPTHNQFTHRHRSISFVFDPAGNRSHRRDYNGAVTNYSYDTLNRLTTISYPDTTSATYGYDVLSRLTTATNPNGTVTIAYDNRSRVCSVTDVFGQVVSYSYDANSNRTQLNLNGSLNASYQYDVINRLTQLTDNASLHVTFAYDATDKLTSRTLPNGVVSTYQYDGLSRHMRLTHAKGANTLADFQYQFNAVNNITQIIDNGGTHNYSYDALDRLTAATHPNQPNESYTYDDVGNRTASHQGSSYTYQAFNHLTSANGTTFCYDTNGNEISKSDASGSWTYGWDYENKLKQAALSGGVVIYYNYDALGRRVQRLSTVNGVTKFVYDRFDVIRDLDGSVNTASDYLNAPTIDSKLLQIQGGNGLYFISDHVGTTRSLADVNGTITSNIRYDSFGNVINSSGATRYTYTGREIDLDIGLMYYRARWYSSQTGRFISEDPIGLDGGINMSMWKIYPRLVLIHSDFRARLAASRAGPIVIPNV